MKNVVYTVTRKAENAHLSGRIDLMQIDNDAVIKRFGKGFSTDLLNEHMVELRGAIRRIRKHYWKEAAVAKMAACV